MKGGALSFLRVTLGSVRDLVPIVLVIGFFQLVVLGQPLPILGQLVAGLVLVMLGLTLFVQGLKMGLFPIGERMAHGLARRGSGLWVLAFAFCLGFGTTVAEPALIAVALEAARAAAESGVVAPENSGIERYAAALRYTVAAAVGTSLVLGVWRIIKGWPIHYLIISGYGIVVALTLVAPDEIVGIAYDAGGVSTSTITVPLVTALGVGLASMIKGRNPMIDGFGLIAFASLLPIIFIMAFGIIWNAVLGP